MSAFVETQWAVVRADALETEAEALAEASKALGRVLGIADNVERLAIEQTIGVLDRSCRLHREQAAKLRAVA